MPRLASLPQASTPPRYALPMLLKVGPFVYHVRLVAGFIRHEGEDCLGLCDNESHELFVSDRCSPAQQVQVICHEYMEAWIYHFGQDGMDKEAWCDLFGLAMTQFVIDLMQTLRMDGKAWLQDVVEMPPPGTTPPPPPEDRPPRATRGRRPAVSVVRATQLHRTADADAADGTDKLGGTAHATAGDDAGFDQQVEVERWRRRVMSAISRGLRDGEGS